MRKRKLREIPRKTEKTSLVNVSVTKNFKSNNPSLASVDWLSTFEESSDDDEALKRRPLSQVRDAE